MKNGFYSALGLGVVHGVIIGVLIARTRLAKRREAGVVRLLCSAGWFIARHHTDPYLRPHTAAGGMGYFFPTPNRHRQAGTPWNATNASSS